MSIYCKKTILFRFWLLVNKEVLKGSLDPFSQLQAAVVSRMRQKKAEKDMLKEKKGLD